MRSVVTAGKALRQWRRVDTAHRPRARKTLAQWKRMLAQRATEWCDEIAARRKHMGAATVVQNRRTGGCCKRGAPAQLLCGPHKCLRPGGCRLAET